MKQVQNHTPSQAALLRSTSRVDAPVKKVSAAQQQALLLFPAAPPRRLYPTKSCAGQRTLKQR